MKNTKSLSSTFLETTSTSTTTTKSKSISTSNNDTPILASLSTNSEIIPNPIVLRTLAPGSAQVSTPSVISRTNSRTLRDGESYGLDDVLFIVGEFYRKEVNHTIGLNRLCYEDDRLLEAVCKHKRSNGRTRLHFACRKRDVNRSLRLINCGADREAKLEMIYWTPLLVLSLPSDHGQFDSPYYVYPSTKTAAKGVGDTELQRKLDLQEREVTIAKALIKKKVNVNAVTSQNESVITLASWQGKYPLIKTLLEAGANPDLKSNTNECGLIYSCTNGFSDIAELLLDYGVNPNTMNDSGANPLIAAVDHNDVALVQKLLEKGADPNILTKSNRDSPLIFASWKNYLTICVMLLNAGADMYHSNTSNSTPIDYALRHNHNKILIEFINAGLDVYKVLPNGLPIICSFIYERKLELIEFLCTKDNIDLNIRTAHRNMTPYEYAKDVRSTSIVKLLEQKLNLK